MDRRSSSSRARRARNRRLRWKAKRNSAVYRSSEIPSPGFPGLVFLESRLFALPLSPSLRIAPAHPVLATFARPCAARAGFAAATYQRGVPFVQMPTTLLAQVDSSVGGKTGVNHPLGKNMIGAFHQPRRVVIDVDTLATLPQRELVAGLAEVIKIAAAADATLFDWLETHREQLLRREHDALRHAVTASCRIKAHVVGEDEREAGRRAILNFGHTIGHAIEAGTGFGSWLHGEAVGCGMALE